MSKNLGFSGVTFATVLALLCQCKHPDAGSSSKADDSEYAKHAWIMKAAAALSSGREALSGDANNSLASLPQDQILDHLMTGIAYEETLLDFSDYYLNSKGSPSLTAFGGGADTLSGIISRYSSPAKRTSVTSAVAIENGTDVFAMFSKNMAPFGMMPLTARLVANANPPQAATTVTAPTTPTSQALTSQQAAIDAQLAVALDLHDQITAAFTPASDGSFAAKAACTKVFVTPGLRGRVTQQLNLAGLFSVANTLQNAWYDNVIYSKCVSVLFAPAQAVPTPVPTVAGTAAPEAGTATTPVVTPAVPPFDTASVLATLTSVRPKIAAAFALAKAYNIEVYSPTTVAGLKPAPEINDLLLTPSTYNPFAGQQFANFSSWPYLDWAQLTNSSTNFNRKRSAYVLRTFFCDDLTPIAVVATADHGQGKHASDPGCQACHYKLDPMAGFFRERGAFGQALRSPVTPTTGFSFDDGRSLVGSELTDYLNTWKAPSGAGRDWDVGYIRSVSRPKNNFYGSSLDDLYGFMASAPEVRQCFVRRLAEYFIGKSQVFDGGWLSALTAQLPAADSPQAATSGTAVKGIIKTLLLSQAFAKRDPDPAKCYDLAPGATPTSLPCEISWTIQNNCASCHASDGASGGLDLTTWGVMSDGENFVDLDENSKQRAKSDTFARLKDRLQTADPALRMPKNNDMPAPDQARLFRFVDGVITALGAGK